MSRISVERIFMHAMVDIITGLTRENIRRNNDELIVPNWLFHNQEEHAEQRLNTFADIVHQIIENRPEGMSDQSADNTMIPEWLYHNEQRHLPIVQENDEPIVEQINRGTNDDIDEINHDVRYSEINREVRYTSRSVFMPDITSLGIPFSTLFRARILHRFRTRSEPEPFKQSKTIEKHIDKNRNTECPITYDDIKFGDAYMTCSDCKYNFSETAIMKHLNEKQICPMCRCDWKDTCKYINKVVIPDELMAKNIIKKLPSIKNACKKDFTKKCNILGEMKSSRYNKRWNYGK
jgi:hypothetical protein